MPDARRPTGNTALLASLALGLLGMLTLTYSDFVAKLTQRGCEPHTDSGVLGIGVMAFALIGIAILLALTGYVVRAISFIPELPPVQPLAASAGSKGGVGGNVV